MTVSFKLRNSPCPYVFLCPCPKSSFHTLTTLTPNRSTSASSSATLLSKNGKLWQSHSLWKGHLLCKYSLNISWFASHDLQIPNSIGRYELLHKKVLMGPALFLNSFSYTAFPCPYSNCPLHSCKGSWSHLSPSKKKYGDVWTGDVWTEGIPIQAPGAPSAAVWSCSGSKIPPFMGSFSNRRHAGIVRAQLPFLARSREAGVCLECLRAAGAGGRDEVMALAGIQGHSHSAIAASSKATFASNIWESLYCLLMAIKGIPMPIFEPSASIYYWFYISAALDGI